MRMSEIVRIDSRGRITMPSSIREATGLSEGMYVMLLVDLDTKEIRISPFADPEAQLVEFQFVFSDVPGALARVVAILAETHVDLLSSTSRTLRRGEFAEWIIIADISKCPYSLEELQKQILSEGAAKKISYRDLLNR